MNVARSIADELPGGGVHEPSEDFGAALRADPAALAT
jgi:hypothetical protein